MRILFLTVCLSVLCGACTRVEPHHAVVAAGSVPAFSTWQRDVAGEFPPELKQEFAAAIQKIRFNVVAQNEATGHDAIEAALCKRVDTHTVNEILLLGDGLKLQRLQTERDDLQKALNTNAQLITKPGDDGAATYLDRVRAQQQQRLDRNKAEIQAVEGRIRANGGGGPSADPGATAPAPLEKVSRDEALKQIATMIEERRSPGVLKYGGWPVKIDREGQLLDPATRQDFLARKTTAESAGRVVIPIRIKEHWLLFEGADQAPQLPKYIQASITLADREKFAEDWVNLEAEMWAREAAASFEIQNPGLPPPSSLAPMIPGR